MTYKNRTIKLQNGEKIIIPSIEPIDIFTRFKNGEKAIIQSENRLATNPRQIRAALLNSVLMVRTRFFFRASIADPEHVPVSLATLSRARAVSRVTYLVTRKSTALVHIKESHNTSWRENSISTNYSISKLIER